MPDDIQITTETSEEELPPPQTEGEQGPPAQQDPPTDEPTGDPLSGFTGAAVETDPKLEASVAQWLGVPVETLGPAAREAAKAALTKQPPPKEDPPQESTADSELMAKNAEYKAEIDRMKAERAEQVFKGQVQSAVGDRKFRNAQAATFFSNYISDRYKSDERGLVINRKTGETVKKADGTGFATLEELAKAHSGELAYLFDQVGERTRQPGGGLDPIGVGLSNSESHTITEKELSQDDIYMGLQATNQVDAAYMGHKVNMRAVNAWRRDKGYIK